MARRTRLTEAQQRFVEQQPPPSTEASKLLEPLFSFLIVEIRPFFQLSQR
jgi:hypothetical protein